MRLLDWVRVLRRGDWVVLVEGLEVGRHGRGVHVCAVSSEEEGGEEEEESLGE